MLEPERSWPAEQGWNFTTPAIDFAEDDKAFHLTAEQTSEGPSLMGWPDGILSADPHESVLLLLGDPLTFPVDVFLIHWPDGPMARSPDSFYAASTSMNAPGSCSNLSRFAGVSVAGARRRNPEQA